MTSITINNSLVSIQTNSQNLPFVMDTIDFSQSLLNNNRFISLAGNLIPPNLRYLSPDYEIAQGFAVDVMFEFPPSLRMMVDNNGEPFSVFCPWISLFITIERTFDPQNQTKFTNRIAPNVHFYISETQIYNILTPVHIFDLYEVDDNGYITSQDFYDRLNELFASNANAKVVDLNSIQWSVLTTLLDTSRIDFDSPRWAAIIAAQTGGYEDFLSSQLTGTERLAQLSKFDPVHQQNQKDFKFDLSLFPSKEVEEILDGLASRAQLYHQFKSFTDFFMFYGLK